MHQSTAIMDFKPVGSLLLCAGRLFPIEELPVHEFQKLMDVNLLGTVIGIKHAAKAMIPAKQGVIISTSSIAGSIAMGTFAYGISTAAIIAATYNASAQLTKHGIRVNCISPGLLTTPMTFSAFGCVAALSFFVKPSNHKSGE
jgi:NAD(P)-dependent dehydrogenase (short-subunit alcohol dehydrogenase family)